MSKSQLGLPPSTSLTPPSNRGFAAEGGFGADLKGSLSEGAVGGADWGSGFRCFFDFCSSQIKYKEKREINGA